MLSACDVGATQINCGSTFHVCRVVLSPGNEYIRITWARPHTSDRHKSLYINGALMLAIVCDADTALNQHWANGSCLLGAGLIFPLLIFYG